MNRMKRAIAICMTVAMLSVASVTALAADGEIPETTVPTGDGFVCQITGGVCTLDHDHGTGLRLGAQDGTGAGLRCTLDHEHTGDCVLTGGICCTLDHEHTQDCILPGSICCTLDHEHTDDCILPGSGAGCGAGRGVGRRDGSGRGHHGGRGRHCA